MELDERYRIISLEMEKKLKKDFSNESNEPGWIFPPDRCLVKPSKLGASKSANQTILKPFAEDQISRATSRTVPPRA